MVYQTKNEPTQTKKKIYLFIFFSCLNLFYCFLIQDFLIFFFRQVFLISFFFFSLFLEEHLKTFSEDYIFINKVLTEKYSLLKLESPLMVLSCCSIFIVSNIFNGNQFLYVLSGIVLSLYLSILIYRFVCIYHTPQVRIFYDFSQRKNKVQSRSFSTVASAVKICVECGRLVGFGFIASYGVPKAIYGADYRSPVVNSVGYIFTGYKSNSEMAYSIANQYFYDDASRPLITEADGVTISKQKLYVQCAIKKLPIFVKYD